MQRVPWAGEYECILLFWQRSAAVGQSFVSKWRRDENVLQHRSQAYVCTCLSDAILAAIAIAIPAHVHPYPSPAQCVQAPERRLPWLPLQLHSTIPARLPLHPLPVQASERWRGR